VARLDFVTVPITTDRLTIRAFAESDLDAAHAYHQLPEVARFLYWAARTREETAAAIAKRMANTELVHPGDGLCYAVELRETGELIGEVNLGLVRLDPRTGEFGFIFNPAHHGRGYAREAALETLRLGFERHDMHRIIGRCDARNTASAGLMTKLGMRQEAHFVRNEFVKGEWCSELDFAMLADEWRAR
jgi:RimJ/RimL family protein N-acetyltransferase